MSRKTRRDVDREIDRLKHEYGDPDAPTDVTVEWRVPDDPVPDSDGIHFDPETATLTYDLWAAQRECLAALEGGECDIAALLGGYGSGKSVFGGRWTVANGLTIPGSQFLALGKTYAEARGGTFRKLFAQLPGDGTATAPDRSPVVAEYVKSEHRLQLTNGTEIVLGSADKPDRYAGMEFGAMWLDEPSYYQADLHDLLEMLDGRLRGVAGPKIQCWTLTGNGYNDAWEILEQRQDATGAPLGHRIELIRASTLENPYLTPEERANQERKYGGTDRESQALYGGFAGAQGLVYSQFDRETHIIPHADALDLVSEEWRVYGYDAGWNNPRVLLELGKTGYDQLVVLDAFVESESHVTDAIAWLERHDRPTGVIYCEHEPADIDRFRQAGYRAEQATKELDAGIAEVRKRLEPDGRGAIHDPTPKKKVHRGTGTEKIAANSDHWEKVGRATYRQTIRPGTSSTDPPRDNDADAAGRVGLLVSAQCQRLIREFLGYKEDEVGTAAATDDCLDALRYVCMGVAGH